MNFTQKIKKFRVKVKIKIAKRITKLYGKKKKQLCNKSFKIMIVYRISDTGYNKVKPSYINNENCLKNAVAQFPLNNHDWIVIADNVSENTYEMIKKYIPETKIQKVSIGHGAGTFRIAYYDIALKEKDENAIVYFLENDYLHKNDSSKILREGFSLCEAEYITLYDHPDKYGYESPNPFVRGGEKTRVFLSESVHWKITDSTTMTFAAQVKTLRRDRDIFDRWTQTKHPYDFQIFIDLARNKRLLISPLPGYSTHGETAVLSPLTDWEKEF